MRGFDELGRERCLCEEDDQSVRLHDASVKEPHIGQVKFDVPVATRHPVGWIVQHETTDSSGRFAIISTQSP